MRALLREKLDSRQMDILGIGGADDAEFREGSMQ